jgi:predicted Zn-ribbon and HTH transcriptional regulator
MIEIYLGNVGSGKTASAVRDMATKDSHITTFSNIIAKLKNSKVMDSKMIVKKEEIGKKRDNTPIYKYTFNEEFWKEQIKKYKNINVIIDEAHTILNSRRAMSKKTQCILDFIALIRRIVTSGDYNGKLILISQLERRLDVVSTEMASCVKYHISHYTKTCQKCGFKFVENSEAPEIRYTCPRCECYKLRKNNFSIEVYQFSSMNYFHNWKYNGVTGLHTKHYLISDIEKYFPLYNTLQWDNMFSDEV